MNKVDRDTLYELYIIQKMPMHSIAAELSISIGSVFNYMKRYEIPARNKADTFTMKGRKLSSEHRQIISAAHKGKKASEKTRRKMSEAKERGGIGHKKKRNDGYIYIYFPDHPRSTKDGYMMEHILVMEAIQGRHLRQDECVHHINGVKDDNRKNNLKLMTKSEHISFHMKKRYEEKRRNDLSIK